MDLSIIIVNWNTKDLLINCLRSVYANVHGIDYQVIVVDNASTDGSQAIVEDLFPDVILIDNEMNLGFACANNIGLTIVKGKYVLLLNSDTLVLDNVIQNSVSYLNNHEKCWAMGCKVLNEDLSIQPSTSKFPSFINLTLQTLGLDKISAIPYFQRYRIQNINVNQASPVETISGCYLMARKEAFDQIGNLDEDFFFFGEETDWCERLRAQGHEIHYAPVGKIIHLGGGSSKPLQYKRDILLTQATVRLHKKHYGLVASFLVYLLLMGFNLSRWLYWSFMHMLKKSLLTNDRRKHFAKVCIHYSDAWPSSKGGFPNAQ